METTYTTHTRTVAKIVHTRTSPRHALTSGDLYDGTSNKKYAHNRTQQSEFLLEEPKVIPKLPKTGENELLSGEKGQA